MEAEEAESSTPHISLVFSVVVVKTSKTRYSERVTEMDLEDLECRK